MANTPSTDLTAPTLEQRARRRVALKKGFFIHATVFVLVNAGLYGLWLFNSWTGADLGPRHHGMRVFPLWGWGLGLAIHGLVVFFRLQGEGLTQRWVDKEIETLKRQDAGGGR